MSGGSNRLPALHEISVSNLIFGQVWFATVPLDLDWQWARGPSLPEVDSTITIRGRRWVASGRAWYAIHHRTINAAGELTLDIKPGVSNPRESRWLRSMEITEGLIGGHRASTGRGTARRGLLRPVTLTLLRAEIPCDLTQRTIRVDLVGNFSRELADQLIENLSELRCH